VTVTVTGLLVGLGRGRAGPDLGPERLRLVPAAVSDQLGVLRVNQARLRLSGGTCRSDQPEPGPPGGRARRPPQQPAGLGAPESAWLPEHFPIRGIAAGAAGLRPRQHPVRLGWATNSRPAGP
jgi:hypothetical protein